jgi:hypothetical protein
MGNGRVFVSYAHKDQELADAFGDLLQAAGIEYFRADRIFSGDDWFKEIAKNLEQAEQVVAILTPNSLASPWVWAEVGCAFLRPNSVRVHALLLDVEPEDLGPLSRVQTCDAKDSERLENLFERLGAGGKVGFQAFLDACNHHRSVNHYSWSPLCRSRKMAADCTNLLSLKTEWEKRHKRVKDLLDELETNAAKLKENVDKELVAPLELTEGLHRLAENQGVRWIGPAKSPQRDNEVDRAWERLYEAICDVGASSREFRMMGTGLNDFFAKRLFEREDPPKSFPETPLSELGRGFVAAINERMKVKVLLLDPAKATPGIDERIKKKDRRRRSKEQFEETREAIGELNRRVRPKKIDARVTQGPLYRSLTYLHRDIQGQAPDHNMLVTHYVHPGLFSESHTVVLQKHDTLGLMADYLTEFESLFGRAGPLLPAGTTG